MKLIFHIIIYFLLSSPIISNEIWEKEIPPSLYLKHYALEQEKRIEKTIRYGGYAMLGMGIISLNQDNPTNEAIALSPLFILGGAYAIILDLVRQSKPFDKPRTSVGKEYKKIRELSNDSEREEKAYNLLVELAEDSRKAKENRANETRLEEYKNRDDRIKGLISDFMGDIVKRQAKKSDIFKTPQEKLLENYLKKKSIK